MEQWDRKDILHDFLALVSVCEVSPSCAETSFVMLWQLSESDSDVPRCI